jgi:hypothetical protein
LHHPWGLSLHDARSPARAVGAQAGETFDEQPNLPSEKDGLKMRQSDTSSGTVIECGGLEGEKGAARGLRARVARQSQPAMVGGEVCALGL